MEEALFKNTSRISEQELTKYQLKMLTKTIILFATVVILISVAVGLPLIFFVNEFVGGAIIVLGALGGAVLLPYLLKDSVKKQNAQILGDRKYLNTYEFFQDKMTIINSATDNFSSSEYKEIARADIDIKNIYKLMVDPIYIFIYLDSRQSLFLDKRGMTKGTAGELVEFIQGKGVKIVDKTKK